MMATSSKKTCSRCGKSGGVFTCNGCEKSFCGHHTTAHRQELTHQLDLIGQEHDLLRRDLRNNTGQGTILARINSWEKESIIKIKMTADKARDDLHELHEQLEISFNQISKELRSSRKFDNYSEIDLNRWTKKLQLIRNELEMSTCINYGQKENKYSIDLIDLSQINMSNTTTTIHTHEWFDQVIGAAIITDIIDLCDTASIRGGISYSSGLHKISFEIVNKKRNYLFFGIMSSIQPLTSDAFSQSSTYGWWDVGYPVLKGSSSLYRNHGNIIQTDDKITLTLDCNQNQISYETN